MIEVYFDVVVWCVVFLVYYMWGDVLLVLVFVVVVDMLGFVFVGMVFIEGLCDVGYGNVEMFIVLKCDFCSIFDFLVCGNVVYVYLVVFVGVGDRVVEM